MTPKRKFKVIDPNVRFVAGKRVPDNRIVEMTEEAARYDVQAGVLELVDDGKAPRTRSASGSTAPVEG